MTKVLITGGCGFIGSNFINYLLNNNEINQDISIVNLDKQTYAGMGRNILHQGLDKNKDYRLIKLDICDKFLVHNVVGQEKPDFIFNFAAESHVDRSIISSTDFIMTNIVGTANLLDVAREQGIEKFIQISTDEVYGSIESGSFSEKDILDPSSTYASSKAAADLQAIAYYKTHGLPAIITRSANNYGPYQFPEKMLPLFITNLIQEKKVPLMWSKENPGLNIRDWLNVKDNCRAIWYIANNGENGEVYNIPGENEETNADMTKRLLDYFGYDESMIKKVEHRKGHDFRYSINGDKIKKLGFTYKHLNLDSELNKLIEWYQDNPEWWKPLKK